MRSRTGHLEADAESLRTRAWGGISNPAARCGWRGQPAAERAEWALHMGWGGRTVGQEQAQGILIAALGTLVAAFTFRDEHRSA